MRSIVYLFAYKETEVDQMEAYRMGRTKPKLATELSILTLRLPHVEKPSSVQDQLINFLGSSRNLNGVFVAMKEEGRKTELLKDRSSQLKKHICSYIDDRYEEYITRVGEKKPMEGRAAGFTMNELGEMPQGEIPPPLAFVEKTVTDQLKEMQADVDKAVEYKNVVLCRFLTRHLLLHRHARAPNCIIDLRWIYEISNSVCLLSIVLRLTECWAPKLRQTDSSELIVRLSDSRFVGGGVLNAYIIPIKEGS